MFFTTLLFLCATAAMCIDSVKISAGGLATTYAEPPPAWHAAARAEDAKTRAAERAADAKTRAAERAADAAILGSLQQSVSGLQQSVSGLQQAVSGLQQAVSGLQQSDISQASILKQVAQAVVTQAVAGQVDQCAPSTALFLEIGGGVNFTHCSAVPMFSVAPAPFSPTSSFLTSAHCFNSHIPGKPVRLAFQWSLYNCSKQHYFNASSTVAGLDLALVRCEGVSAPPTTISAQPYLLHQPAALLGFSPGSQVSSNRMAIVSDDTLSVLHIRFTRLALTMQNPKAHGDATRTSFEHGAGSIARLSPHDVTGFVDASPEQGMSGGAVVDLQCGLWGITKSKSAWGVGSSFVVLNPAVVAMVQAVAAVF